MKTRLQRFFTLRLVTDRRGLAAVEFALIAPVLIFLFMGVLEMSLRFRASEEASRYVHQVADLISRETSLTTTDLGEIYDAAVHMMQPLDTVDRLDFDAASVGFRSDAQTTPYVMWRRVAGQEVPLQLDEVVGMGLAGETVVRVGIRYRYDSPLTTLFNGRTIAIERTAYARPRETRRVSMDGQVDDGGVTGSIGS